MTWLLTIISVFCVSLISLVGLALMPTRAAKSFRLLHVLLCFSVGIMIGNVCFDLLPEAIEAQMSISTVCALAACGFIIFVLIELSVHRFSKFRTSQKPSQNTRTKTDIAIMNFTADGIHNFVDGILIAAAFIIAPNNPQIGITTTLAVILHEIPQELGDYSIFLSAGFSQRKALTLNFLSALTAVVGAILTIVFSEGMQSLSVYFLPIAAGGFVYLALFGLLPIVHKHCHENEERGLYSYSASFLIIAVGFFFTYAFTSVLHE